MKNTKRIIFSIFFLLAFVMQINAQEREITGTVKDASGEPLIGVTVVKKDQPGFGTATDIDGNFKIRVARYDVLVFTYIGYDPVEVSTEGKTHIPVTMAETTSKLEEVVITATGPQRKATLTGAITNVDTKTLKTPTANISNALVGNVPGIIGRQTSGEPGANYTEFWIRGISTFGANASALVLVDGVERNFNEINVEDIESFSVLKDASATAVYGQRGANGVVLITTKKGNAGKVNINFKGEFGYVTRSRMPEYVDGITYANLANEARLARYQDPQYSPSEIAIINNGLDPDLYPNVNWRDRVLRDGTTNHRASVNISGGGTTARYFISAAYYSEDGMYKDAPKGMNDYSTNAKYNKFNYRANVDVNVTKSTIVNLGVSGWIVDQNKPGHSTTDNMWMHLMTLSPVAVPVMYSNGLIPTDDVNWAMNPEALLTRTGYKDIWENKAEINVTIQQDLSFITEGLNFSGMYAFDNYNWNEVARYKNPELYLAERQRDANGNIIYRRMLESSTLAQTTYTKGDRRNYLEANLVYEKLLNEKHRVGGLVKYYQQQISRTDLNKYSDIIWAIPKRNLALSGRVTYGFMDRYLAEFNFGYTGSENFEKGERFGFFPAIAGGWVISEEPFVKKALPWLDMFKIRYSYGEVGNDVIPDDNRFPYLTQLSTQGSGYNWGEYGSNQTNGYGISILGSSNLTWERAKKHNLGIDWNLFNSKITGTVDFFKDNRSKIFIRRNNMPYSTGLEDLRPWVNLGKMESKGVDGNIAFTQKVKDINFTLRANMTYAKNEVLESDEAANEYYYKMAKGYRHNQTRGLIALGLFKDQQEIDESPKQNFGSQTVMPGDIKYKDVNGDGIINEDDVVPIGYTTTPNLSYGFGLSVDWKGFDFSVLFQGSGKSDFFLGQARDDKDVGGGSVYPFKNGAYGNVLTAVANPKDRWIPREISGDPSTENPNALFPRLSYGGNENNYRNSTFWLRDASYLRLKNLEIGYTLPKKLTRTWAMESVRVFFLGYNLLVFSDFDYWDPEIGSGTGAKYPINKTYSLGLTVSF
ncbi:MAG: TonB-dependent receptor [Dysgonomonas sp.]|nr:TonB-dependent receptor [Dysgonomonas sp.]